MTHETIDETIDRVAREWTEVGADAAFAERVRARLAQPRRPWVVPAMAVASVGVVLLVIWLPRAADSPTRPQAPTLAARSLASWAALPPAAEAPARSVAVNTEVQTPRPRVTAAPEAVAAVANVPAAEAPLDLTVPAMSAGPAAIAIAELNVVPVLRPDVMAIAPIDVAALDVPELPMIHESKEQR
jgi:hypothetical protein